MSCPRRKITVTRVENCQLIDARLGDGFCAKPPAKRESGVARMDSDFQVRVFEPLTFRFGWSKMRSRVRASLPKLKVYRPTTDSDFPARISQSVHFCVWLREEDCMRLSKQGRSSNRPSPCRRSLAFSVSTLHDSGYLYEVLFEYIHVGHWSAGAQFFIICRPTTASKRLAVMGCEDVLFWLQLAATS